jgi:hypothetical protein
MAEIVFRVEASTEWERKREWKFYGKRGGSIEGLMECEHRRVALCVCDIRTLRQSLELEIRVGVGACNCRSCDCSTVGLSNDLVAGGSL